MPRWTTSAKGDQPPPERGGQSTTVVTGRPDPQRRFPAARLAPPSVEAGAGQRSERGPFVGGLAWERETPMDGARLTDGRSLGQGEPSFLHVRVGTP